MFPLFIYILIVFINVINIEEVKLSLGWVLKCYFILSFYRCCSLTVTNLNILYFSVSDQKLVSEQANEAEEDGAGRPGSRLPGQRRLSLHALPQGAGVQAGPLPQIPLSSSSTGGSSHRFLPPPTQPTVQLPSAQCLHSASGLFLPVQQPPSSRAALHHDSAHGILPNLSSVLLTLPVKSCGRDCETRWNWILYWNRKCFYLILKGSKLNSLWETLHIHCREAQNQMK